MVTRCILKWEVAFALHFTYGVRLGRLSIHRTYTVNHIRTVYLGFFVLCLHFCHIHSSIRSTFRNFIIFQIAGKRLARKSNEKPWQNNEECSNIENKTTKIIIMKEKEHKISRVFIRTATFRINWNASCGLCCAVTLLQT